MDALNTNNKKINGKVRRLFSTRRWEVGVFEGHTNSYAYYSTLKVNQVLKEWMLFPIQQ